VGLKVEAGGSGNAYAVRGVGEVICQQRKQFPIAGSDIAGPAKHALRDPIESGPWNGTSDRQCFQTQHLSLVENCLRTAMQQQDGKPA
jgi:hypothetical protein